MHNYLEKFNATASEEAKIYSDGIGQTSNLMKRLYKEGYRSYQGKLLHTLEDPKGKWVSEAYSRIGLLINISTLGL